MIQTLIAAILAHICVSCAWALIGSRVRDVYRRIFRGPRKS
jgi:hypothetical protein